MERLKVDHDEITLHVDSERSGGTMVAAEVTIPAGGGPPALHRHPSAELYRVQRGELALYLGDERISAGEGAVVHIPGGTAHTIRNETDAEAQAFVVFTPGTEMERFVRAVAASPGDVLALAREHGIEMLTP
jgi:mannose-6-phosphate isomerase-like protein (cupin superfamily)